MESDPRILEEKAHDLLSQEKFEESFKLFKSAAELYKAQAKHKQAALCLAAAASCWGRKCGERPFYNSASAYEEAARQSQISGDFEYASLLYKYAALNYERDGEFLNFSDCFYRSKESYRRFLTYLFLNPKKIRHIAAVAGERMIRKRLKFFFAWLLLSFSYFVWGYGERPLRAFFSALAIVFVSAIFYTYAGVLKEGIVANPGFFEALYFSVVTFTTVGYGDVIAVGLSRIVAVLEAFCGVFITPLFIVALSRKYLRV